MGIPVPPPDGSESSESSEVSSFGEAKKVRPFDNVVLVTGIRPVPNHLTTMEMGAPSLRTETH